MNPAERGLRRSDPSNLRRIMLAEGVYLWIVLLVPFSLFQIGGLCIADATSGAPV